MDKFLEKKHESSELAQEEKENLNCFVSIQESECVKNFS